MNFEIIFVWAVWWETITYGSYGGKVCENLPIQPRLSAFQVEDVSSNLTIRIFLKYKGGYNSIGRVYALQAWSCQFKSDYLQLKFNIAL